MKRGLLAVLHNPRNRTCACADDCWCKTTALGRAFRWWFPARRFGIHHKSAFGGLAQDERKEWKRRQSESQGS